MKKTNKTQETAVKAETKTANTKTAKTVAKAETKKNVKTEEPKVEEPKVEKTPKTVELPDPAKMTREDYKKVSRKMRRLRRAGRTEEYSTLKAIVDAARKNLGIGEKPEKEETEKPAEKPAKTAEKKAPAKKAEKEPKKGSSKRLFPNADDGHTPSFANGGLQRHLLTFPA